MANTRTIRQDLNVRFIEPSSDDKYDLYVQGVFQPTFEGLMTFALGTPSDKIAGLIKLSQQFLITLFTSVGSDIFEPTRGTAMANLIGGNFYDQESLKRVIVDSIRSASTQVITQQATFRPIKDDEVLRAAQLVRLDVQVDRVYPYVLLTSIAGSLTSVKLPTYSIFA